MGMVNFSALFPDVDAREVRLVTPIGHASLPQRPFALVENACALTFSALLRSPVPNTLT